MSTCNDALGQIGGEIAKAWEGKQTDEDALVAIDEVLAAETGGPEGGCPTARALEAARHARFGPPDDDPEHAPDPQQADGGPADGAD